MSEIRVYKSWQVEAVVTTAPSSMRLVDADAYDAMVAARDRLQEALRSVMSRDAEYIDRIEAENDSLKALVQEIYEWTRYKNSTWALKAAAALKQEEAVALRNTDNEVKNDN